MPAPTLSQRTLKEAKQQATFQANKILTAWKRDLLHSWNDIERLFSISVPEIWKLKPCDNANVSGFARWWMTSFESRLSAAIENKVEVKKIVIDKDVSTFGATTLFPEQEAVYKAIYKSMFIERSIKAAINDGQTGSGKTIIGAALCARLIADGLLERPEMRFRLHPIMIFSPKGVVESWKRELDKAGLAEYVRKRKIYVISDSIFTTDYGEAICGEEENYITGETFYKWNPMMVPWFALIDECHRYSRWSSKRFKKMLSLANAPEEHYMLFMSATPFEKVNDAAVFTIACRTKFMDIDVREDTFKFFANLIDTVDPNKPNAEALKRLRKVLSANIFSIPYVKPKHKAINQVLLVDFLNDKHKEVYATAHQRYIEACRKSGQNTLWGRFEHFIALNNFRKTAEPLRAWYLADRAAENFKNGHKATVVFAAFKETITETAFRLVDKYGIDRNRISIIWGGKREYKTEEIIPREELENLVKTTDMMELLENKVLLKRIRISLKYYQDQFDHSETVEEQSYRHAKLKELKLLGKQSDNNRQLEIDNFQDGTSIICLATLASGGVGLSLDKNNERLLEREGLYTPVYSGKDYKQALGRLVRRASIADAYQYTIMLKGTVEEYHVAPRLDVKLKSIASFTNRSLEDIVELLALDIPVISAPPHLRSSEEALQDAEKDDTIVHESPVDDDDDDEEEVENPEELIPLG